MKKIQPRFRIFAGPNGSGKTSLFNFLRERSYIHTEIYVNADYIEKKISKSLTFNFNAYKVKVSDEEFKSHIIKSGILTKVRDKTFINKIELCSGILKIKTTRANVNSYIASFIATYLAEKLLESGQSFCYETVLSHPAKLNLLTIARSIGYKSYLYFLFTDNWRLNVERVRLRVKEGGHDVENVKIEQRYFRSLKLFKQASELADDSFLIDNSKDFRLKCEIKNGIIFSVADDYPTWLLKYFNPNQK